MKDVIDHIGEGVRNFMMGCYGVDDFAKRTLIVTLILFILSLFFGSRILYLLAVAGDILSWYRMLSKDQARRLAENQRYLHIEKGFLRVLDRQKKRLDGTRDFCFFKCPNCGQEVRVPKGVGHIRITCPKCHTQFDRTV